MCFGAYTFTRPQKRGASALMPFASMDPSRHQPPPCALHPFALCACRKSVPVPPSAATVSSTWDDQPTLNPSAICSRSSHIPARPRSPAEWPAPHAVPGTVQECIWCIGKCTCGKKEKMSAQANPRATLLQLLTGPRGEKTCIVIADVTHEERLEETRHREVMKTLKLRKRLALEAFLDACSGSEPEVESVQESLYRDDMSINLKGNMPMPDEVQEVAQSLTKQQRIAEKLPKSPVLADGVVYDIDP